MNAVHLFHVLLFVFLLRHVCTEPVFRAEGGVIEMGYCLGLEHVVVYRSYLEGDQLIGSSSNHSMPDAPGAHLQGRTRLTDDYDLHGLQIGNLTDADSGSYRTECWKNQTRVSQLTQELSVCDLEIESDEMVVQKDGGAHIWCNGSVALEGTSVRWYHEIYPSFELTLFLDSSVSSEPLVEVPGVVEAREGGALLVLDDRVIKNSHNFYCLIIKDSKCVSFQNIYPPDPSESLLVFASQGDRVVLNCPAQGSNLQWGTPLGKITERTKKQDMYVSAEAGGDFSLVIVAASGEHSGDYVCLSSLAEIHYSLVLCSKQETHQKVSSEGSRVSVACDSSPKNSERVLWYRHQLSGRREILQDNEDATISIPEGLKGRLTLSEDGSLMTISGLLVTDSGEYWCVVLQSDQYMEYNRNYMEVLDEDHIDHSTQYSDLDYLTDTQRCLFKITTNLTICVDESCRVGRAEAVTPPVDSSGVSNVAACAAGGVLVGLLVVGAIVAGIVVKKKASHAERHAASLSPPQRSDIELQRDPGCSQR